MKKLSCIVLNYNTAEMTRRAFTAFIDAAEDIDFEVILIDNGSSEGFDWQGSDRVSVIKNQHNLGFAAAVNQGIRQSSGEYVLLLNSDVLISREAVGGMMAFADSNPTSGIIGPRLNFPDGSFQESAGWMPSLVGEFLRFSTLGKRLHRGMLLYVQNYSTEELESAISVEWVSGGCMLVRREVIEQIGLFDEAFFFSVEDIDYCLRAARAGYHVSYLPYVSATHYHGYSSGGHASVFSARQEKKSMAYFLKKHRRRSYLLRAVSSILYGVKIFGLSLRYAFK